MFFKGLLLGFLVAAPVGPIGLLCIRRTLAQSRLHGFLTGLGAATADAAYGAVAAFGLTAVSSFLVGQQFWFRLVGGIFLVYLGLKIGFSKSGNEKNAKKEKSLLATYLSSLFLTVTNPATILSFAAAFAGLGLTAGDGPLDALLLVAGVFLGSAAWWLLLSGATGLARKKLSERMIRGVNGFSGTLIAGFGIWALVSLWR